MAKKSNRINTETFFTFSVFAMVGLISYFLFQNGSLEEFVGVLKPYALIPELLAGAMYTSVLTTPLAVALFFIIGRYNDPLYIALVAATTAMVVDLTILKFFRYLVFGKRSPIAQNPTFRQMLKALRSWHIFAIAAPVLGALIIASPFPDELGIVLLGLSRLKSLQIGFISYLLNALGIYAITYTAHNLP